MAVGIARRSPVAARSAADARCPRLGLGLRAVALAIGAAAVLLAIAVAAQAQTGNDASTGNYGYVWVNKPLAYDEIRIGYDQSWILHDAMGTFPLPAGLTLRAYGTSYTGPLLVSDNGFVTMAATGGSAAQQYTPVQIPNAADPNVLVAPWWVDMEMECVGASSPPAGTTDMIYGEVRPAVTPFKDRTVITEWDGISLYGQSGECSLFNQMQVKQYEGTDIVEFEYMGTHRYASQGPLSFCQPVSVGVENGGGSMGLRYSFITGCTGDVNYGNQARRIFKNDVPNAQDITVPVTPGVATSFQLTANDDPLQYTLIAAPAASLGTLSNFPLSGTYYKPAQDVTFTPVASFCGTAELEFQANDLYDPVETYTITFEHQCTTNTAPTAVCSVTPAAPHSVGQSLTFSGTSSTDPEADPLTYAWAFPGGTPATSTSATQAVTFSTPGAKAVTLTVTDDGGLASAAASCPVTIGSGQGPPPPPPVGPPPPPPPVTGCGLEPGFSFPVDGTAVAGATVTFSDLSTPASGATLNAWDWTFGDGYVAQGETASHAYATAGQFQVGLAVTDSSGCSAYLVKLLTVTWPGGAEPSDGGVAGDGGAGTPVVYAGDDVTVDEGDPVRLAATGYGAQGAAMTYVWRQVSGLAVAAQGAQSDVLTFTAPATGGQDLRLAFGVTASDGYGTSAEDTVTVTVRASNHVPLANAGPDQTVAPGQPFTLSAAASSDPDGDALLFTWALVHVPGSASAATGIPGLDATGASVQLTAPAQLVGTAFDVQLTASDGVSASADTVRIWVLDGGTPAPAFVARPQPGGAIQFTAAQEADTYAWDFGDGNATTTDQRSVSHRYAEAGTYTVELRLDGASQGSQQTVTAAQGADSALLVQPDGSPGAAAWLGLAFALVAALLVGSLLVWALRPKS